MADQDGQEKSEQPTGKKLEDARDKVRLLKVPSLNSLAVFGSGLIIIYLMKGFSERKFPISQLKCWDRSKI